MQFQESDLIFYFGPSWMARKYDDHRFYSRLSGAGLKAVDFITISQNDELIFWEIKNFNKRKPGLTHDPVQFLIDRETEFVQAMSQKVEDTFLAIRAIHQYYRRKWSFRIREWSMSYVRGSRSDWYFWLKAHQIAARPEHCRFILFMESEERHRLPDLQKPIRESLTHVVGQVDILDKGSTNGSMDVTVKSL